MNTTLEDLKDVLIYNYGIKEIEISKINLNEIDNSIEIANNMYVSFFNDKIYMYIYNENNINNGSVDALILKNDYIAKKIILDLSFAFFYSEKEKIFLGLKEKEV